MTLTIKEVKEKHEARLLKIDGVVSIGIGLNKDKNPAIILGMERLQPEVLHNIPKVLDGYPLEVQMVGYIQSQ